VQQQGVPVRAAAHALRPGTGVRGDGRFRAEPVEALRAFAHLRGVGLKPGISTRTAVQTPLGAPSMKAFLK